MLAVDDDAEGPAGWFGFDLVAGEVLLAAWGGYGDGFHVVVLSSLGLWVVLAVRLDLLTDLLGLVLRGR